MKNRLLKALYLRTVYTAKMKRMPVNKGQILFFTFQGEYTCNPKYISEEIIKRSLPWKQVWVTLKNPRSCGNAFPPDVKLVRFNTKEYYDALATSEVWIDNAFNFVKGVAPKKPEQLFVETMHGSLGIKKIGPDVIHDRRRNRRGRRCGRLTDYCLSNSTFENMVYETSFWKKDSIVLTGHARNDIFFRDRETLGRIRQKVFRYFSLNPDGRDLHLALYAPTFRNSNEASAFEEPDPDKLIRALEQRFGGEWYLLMRAHHSGSDKTGEVQSGRVLSATDYPDIQELMIAADFGITDYSSWIFDYVLTRKNGLLYVPDLETYDAARGFYYPIQEAPFPMAKSNKEMEESILHYDEEQFRNRTEQFLQARGCMDDGHASERIVDLIEQALKRK